MSSQLSEYSGQSSHLSVCNSIKPPSKKSTIELSGKATGIQQRIKLLERCEESIVSLAKLKLLLDCLYKLSLSDGSSVESSILNKLRLILASHETTKYLQLPNIEKTKNHPAAVLNLLGITDVPNIHCDRHEKNCIGVAVEKIFQEKMNVFLKSYEEYGGRVNEILKNQESAGKAYFLESCETDLIRWNKLMNEVFMKYRQDLETFAELLSQWQQFKYIDTKELRKKNAESLLLKAQVAEAQMSVSKVLCTSRMFNETSYTINAFGMMSDHLDSLILNAREEIKKKEILKMNYADVSSPDYDMLVKKNMELDSIIKKKEHLLKML